MSDETPTQDPRQPRESKPEPTSDTLVVKVESPFWCTSFTSETDEGETLVIDRVGVEVSRDSLGDLREAAAKHGITLSTEGE